MFFQLPALSALPLCDVSAVISGAKVTDNVNFNISTRSIQHSNLILPVLHVQCIYCTAVMW